MASPRARVVWSEAAASDLVDIIAYIAARDPANANRVLARLRSAAARLDRHARRGRLVPELSGFGLREWRELVCAPYRIIYRVEDRDVTVLAVFDGRRDLQDVLMERLLRVR